jgi:hypothetical protein
MTTRIRKRSLPAFVALIGVLLMSSGFALIASAGSASANGQTKYFVCKYTGPPPGTPHHIISTASPSQPLGQFNDAHDSFTLVEDTGQPEPPLSACPSNGEPEPDDLCPNIEGIQETIPEGLVKNDAGHCVEPEPEDVCPNIDGIQETVPAGFVKDEAGNCVEEQVEPPAVCGPGTDFPDRLADGSQGPCNEEVSPPGEEPPAAAPPVNNPPAKAPTPTKRATSATVAGPTTSTPSSTVAGPTIPSTVKAGLGEDVAELAATRTSQGLALVGAGALVMLAGGLGMVRRRGVVARI